MELPMYDSAMPSNSRYLPLSWKYVTSYQNYLPWNSKASWFSVIMLQGPCSTSLLPDFRDLYSKHNVILFWTHIPVIITRRYWKPFQSNAVFQYFVANGLYSYFPSFSRKQEYFNENILMYTGAWSDSDFEILNLLTDVNPGKVVWGSRHYYCYYHSIYCRCLSKCVVVIILL